MVEFKMRSNAFPLYAKASQQKLVIILCKYILASVIVSVEDINALHELLNLAQGNFRSGKIRRDE